MHACMHARAHAYTHTKLVSMDGFECAGHPGMADTGGLVLFAMAARAFTYACAHTCVRTFECDMFSVSRSQVTIDVI